ncbi:MAG: sugar phosphate isomerase/epimerase [Verrucomicrobia bacterium]|nr:sugar phosphate isomerase/epimerase [Verrucomicrobiota bacterium]MBU4497852.1 sugar phosphate isomerase/epimerase [Verrucomicrobiota bacterium]
MLAGYPAIELACFGHHFNMETARKEADRIAVLIREAGLTVSALSLFNNFTDPQCFEEQIQAVETYLRLAPLFGTKLLKMTPGAPASAQATEVHWNCIKEALKHLIPMAEKFDVLLAFETHMRQLTDTLASSKRLLEMADSNRIGLTVDFSNMAFAGETMPCVMDAFRGRIYNTHLKNGYIDKAGGWHFQALNEGYVDYSELLRMLRGAEYGGYFTIECLGPAAKEQPVATAIRDLKILKQYLALT